MVTKGQDMERPAAIMWVVLSVVGMALVMWGIMSGSLAFTVAPAVLTVGCIAMAVVAARNRGSRRRG
ncbi:hypothetical protein O1W71_04445 [Microbacterium sp. H37-C3]|uniref:hypothetical protein n=1 Tax=Microbacterium sp. H37-C3 TaxID=3004354 RepID=UPI0022AF50E7|nr:hypothetical protein [Microbacterium sp. H37-C3]MCZ4066912.1 hypothetical protein [Microbacterium sp. H37-C3]